MTYIDRNFVVGKGGFLHSLRYQNEEYESDDEHELRRFLRLWQDPEYLEGFFEEHKEDIRSGFYGRQTFESFIRRTGQDAKQLIRKLYEVGNDTDPSRLNALFKPLDNRPHGRHNYEQLKASGEQPTSWLRLYALQTRDGKIFIVGGAIKLVHKMKERPHLKRELDRLIAIRKELSFYIRGGTLVELTVTL